jgi:hypothetical protein
MVLSCLDGQSSARFGYDDFAESDPSQVEALVACGLLQEVEYARSVVCDGCDLACQEDVVFVEGDGDSPLRAYIICQQRDDIGRVEVPLERLRQWVVDPEALAATLAKLLDTSAEPEEIVRGRMWRLGSLRSGRSRVDVFLAVGAGRLDAERTFRDPTAIKECLKPVVLVPWHVPTRPLFGTDAKVMSVARLLSLDDGGLQLDRSEVRSAMGQEPAKRTQDVPPFPTPDGVIWEQVVVEFQNDNVVKITAGSVVDHKAFSDMGFVDRRKKPEQPDKLWRVLRMIAEYEGEIGWKDDVPISLKERGKMKKWFSDIRKRLRAYFPTIPGDPFEPYRKAKAYKTIFILR